MKPERWVELEKLYNEVVDSDPEERDQRLSAVPDEELRREVLSLIVAGSLSSDIAAWLKHERKRLVQQEALTGPAQDVAAPPVPEDLSHTFNRGDVLASRYEIIGFLGQGEWVKYMKLRIATWARGLPSR